MNTIDSEALLREILESRPDATPDDIRELHPVFRDMSLDHLNLRIDAARPRRPATGGK